MEYKPEIRPQSIKLLLVFNNLISVLVAPVYINICKCNVTCFFLSFLFNVSHSSDKALGFCHWWPADWLKMSRKILGSVLHQYWTLQEGMCHINPVSQGESKTVLMDNYLLLESFGKAWYCCLSLSLLQPSSLCLRLCDITFSVLKLSDQAV